MEPSEGLHRQTSLFCSDGLQVRGINLERNNLLEIKSWICLYVGLSQHIFVLSVAIMLSRNPGVFTCFLKDFRMEYYMSSLFSSGNIMVTLRKQKPLGATFCLLVEREEKKIFNWNNIWMYIKQSRKVFIRSTRKLTV